MAGHVVLQTVLLDCRLEEVQWVQLHNCCRKIRLLLPLTDSHDLIAVLLTFSREESPKLWSGTTFCVKC